jgi:Putative auto-transporter adhesin, head GIN domain
MIVFVTHLRRRIWRPFLKSQNQRIMKKVLLSLLVMSLTGFIYAQKTVNDPNAEKRNVTGFHGIDVGGGIDLFLSSGDEAVAVSAGNDEVRDRIKTEVKDGILKIWYEWDRKLRIDWKNKKMKAYVSYKQLDRLHASGGSDVFSDGSIKADKLDMQASGGSDIKISIEVSELNVNASGGSDIIISGIAKNIDIDASGGSDFKGYELQAENCKANASGGSDIFITVNKELSADASGGSDVHYKGTGLIRDIKSSGGGSVKRSSK